MSDQTVRNVILWGWITAVGSSTPAAWTSLPNYTVRMQLPGGGYLPGITVGRPWNGPPVSSSTVKYVPFTVGTRLKAIATYVGKNPSPTEVVWEFAEPLYPDAC